MSDVGDASDGSDTSSDTTSQDGAELMITTRERRKTAGNRYSQVVAQEQAEEDEEDDVALLFAEAEGEDEEYNSDEADDEADMTSSDDDDQGPNAAADDMEGEKEVQKKEKAERQKKRKADMALTTMGAIRKKPKIDPTSLHRAPDRPKPSKRKERISWLPEETSAPGRTSLRKQTVAHREFLLERLKENEEQRLKNKAIRDRKEKEKQADAPKELTQADRLAEAEKNERRNAKSLNRWEAMEAQRAEEQAAKLAALKDRKLNGAVLTTLSSRYVYRGPLIERISPGPGGNDEQQVKKRGRKTKEWHEQQSAVSQAPPGPFVQSPFTNVVATYSKPTFPLSTASTPTQPKAPASQASGDDWLAGIHEYAMQSASGQMTPQESRANLPEPQQNFEKSKHPASDSAGKVNPGPGISQSTPQPVQNPQGNAHDEQNLDRSTADPLRPEISRPQDSSNSASQPNEVPAHNPPAVAPSAVSGLIVGDIKAPQQEKQPIEASDEAAQPTTAPVPQLPTQMPNQYMPSVPQQSAQATVHPAASTPQATTMPQQPTTSLPVSNPPSYNMPATMMMPSFVPATEQQQPPPPPMTEVTSTRNLVVLEGFEDLTTDAKQTYNVFYGTKKAAKALTKHVTELCPITGATAKYRDPRTGVTYANVAAYKKLEDLQKHTYQWSGMLGCYVGRVGHIARGVPEGFLRT